MPNFKFTGPAPRFYPEYVGPNGSLIAEPGDVISLDEPPTDGLWAETGDPETVIEPGSRSWPLQIHPSEPEPAAEAAGEPADPAPSVPVDPPLAPEYSVA